MTPSSGADVRGATEARRPLVLIVDDDERNRKLARDVLGAAGFVTLAAGSAVDGIALAGRHAPDVVLMDLRLPGMDGATAARRLGDQPATARIPVVAMSALALTGDEEWLRAAGFVGFIGKPIDVDTFADRVRRYCAGDGE